MLAGLKSSVPLWWAKSKMGRTCAVPLLVPQQTPAKLKRQCRKLGQIII